MPSSPPPPPLEAAAVMLAEEEGEEGKGEGNAGGRKEGLFCINDNVDLLAEVLARLDGRSLAAATCVCRLWGGVARRDSVWEAVCLRHVAGGPAAPGATRSVVNALGGYRRLYRLCIGPALDRLSGAPCLSLSLSLSLFSIDCYERLGVGGRQQQQQQQKQMPSSLLFLRKPVDVSRAGMGFGVAGDRSIAGRPPTEASPGGVLFTCSVL